MEELTMWQLFEAASVHGADEGSEAEIGDLHEIISVLWFLLTPQQRQEVSAALRATNLGELVEFKALLGDAPV